MHMVCRCKNTYPGAVSSSVHTELTFSILQPHPKRFHVLPSADLSAGCVFCVCHVTETGGVHCEVPGSALLHIGGIPHVRYHCPENAVARSPARQKTYISEHSRLHLISYGIAECLTLNPFFATCAPSRVRGCTQRRDPIGFQVLKCGARKSRWVAEQLLEFLLALRFCPLHFVFPCASLHFHA